MSKTNKFPTKVWERTMREYRVSDHPTAARLRKSSCKPFFIRLSLPLLIAIAAPAYSQAPAASIFCGAVHSYVCTPEQALAEQRRQMQRRDPSVRPEGQQAYGRWLYLQQIQRQRMEQGALEPFK
jgi:hypothetical protein